MASRKFVKASELIEATEQILPYLVSISFLVIFLIATDKQGLGLSTDSVSYARAAENFHDTGNLQVPLTWWDEEAKYAPLSHFPPVIPLVLAFLSFLLKTDPVTAGRWLNAGCIFMTSFALLRPISDSLLKLFVVIALISGASFLYLHLWLYSEPLFLLLTVISFWIGVSALKKESRYSQLILLAVVCGIATLTRYAGLSLFMAFLLIFYFHQDDSRIKAKKLLLYSSVYLITILPWFLWLFASGNSARNISIYTYGFGNDVINDLAPTIVHWVIPFWLPKALKIAIFVAGLGYVSILFIKRIREGKDCWLGSPMCVSLILGVSYLAFVMVSRLIADSAIPFDERILFPFLMFVALSLSYLLESACNKGPCLVAGFILLSSTAISNVQAAVPYLLMTARNGNGFSSAEWKRSETIAWLRTLPENVTIFSNGADAICARLPVAAKYTLRATQSSSQPEFARRAEGASPSVVVLFNDVHDESWMLPREEFGHLNSEQARKFSDSLVFSWGLPIDKTKPAN
jgi:hypothetical protein